MQLNSGSGPKGAELSKSVRLIKREISQDDILAEVFGEPRLPPQLGEFTPRDVAAKQCCSVATAQRWCFEKFRSEELTRRRGVQNGKASWIYRQALQHK